MIAGIVSRLGCFIENDSRPPDEHNPMGYFESKRIQDLNARLIDRLDGSGRRPPKAPVGWEDRSEFSKEKERARSIVEDYEGNDSWCMKDDRFSITLPLWKRVLPREVSYIVCVRNPLAVVTSMKEMTADEFDSQMAFRVWSAYTKHAILNTQQEKRILMLYEEFQRDPSSQVKRMCDLLGVEAKLGLEAEFKQNLSHQQPSLRDFLDEGDAPTEAKLLYLALLATLSRTITVDEVGRSLDRSP